MVGTTEYKNPQRVGLVRELEKSARKEGAGVWKDVAEALSKSRKNRPSVNMYRLNKNTSDGETVVVPGTVIGSGRLNHKIEVAAFKFTEGARKQIIAAGGKTTSIPELIKKNSKGSGIKIIS
ncbi:MAG: 50S ribosomal protein L18e [Candidatus Altiarchaeota archaeon]